MRSKTRRQAYAEETREAILQSAHKLFTRQRFSGTSIDAIAAKAQVTKGAVYHHFKDKKAVFSACFERQASQVAAAIAAAPEGNDDWQTAHNHCRAFLDFIIRKGPETLSLQEAITVLGWETWREIDTRYTMGYIERMVIRLQQSGKMKPYTTALVTNMIYSMLVDAAMSLGSLPDAKKGAEELADLVTDMLNGLKAE